MINQNPEINQIGHLIDIILTQEKYSKLTNNEKIKFKSELLLNFNKRINNVILNNIPEQFHQSFMDILERDDETETQSFINNHIPNAKQLLEKETEAFLNTILNR